MESQSARPEVGGVSPSFIAGDVPTALAFYRDTLGCKLTFEGPEPDDIFFGIVQRGLAMLMFKDIGKGDVSLPRNLYRAKLSFSSR